MPKGEAIQISVNKKPKMWYTHTMEYYLALKRNEAKSSPCLPKLEKARAQQRRPNAAKNK